MSAGGELSGIPEGPSHLTPVVHSQERSGGMWHMEPNIRPLPGLPSFAKMDDASLRGATVGANLCARLRVCQARKLEEV